MHVTLRTAAVAVFVLACACGGGGGGDSGAEGGGAPLDTAFAGTWTGTTSMAFTGGGSTSYTGKLVITVSGNTATVAKICPDGSQSAQASGSGDSASWSGNIVCPPVSFTNCASVTLTFQSATTTLNAGNLTLIATGSGSGCGSSVPLTVTFSGTRS